MSISNISFASQARHRMPYQGERGELPGTVWPFSHKFDVRLFERESERNLHTYVRTQHQPSVIYDVTTTMTVSLRCHTMSSAKRAAAQQACACDLWRTAVR